MRREGGGGREVVLLGLTAGCLCFRFRAAITARLKKKAERELELELVESLRREVGKPLNCLKPNVR